MKINISALAGLALSAISLTSHAGFTASLSGPTALRPGYSGTFALTVLYTPIAIDPLESFGMAPPGSFDWSRGPAIASFHGAYFYKDGVEYTRTYNFPGATGSFSPFNANQSAVIARQFVWTAGDAGIYDMTFAIDKLESVGHYQNAQCWADPSCPRLGAINGTDDYFDVIEARFGVVVSPTAPIPEPETPAMMLAGLGLMGAIARRRKAKQV